MLEDLARVEFALPIVPLVSPRSTIARNGSEFVCEYDARLEQGDDDDAVARAIVSEALAPLRAELSRRLATAALEFGADATARAACVAEAIDVEALAREVRWFAPGAAITRLRPADDPTTDRGKSRRGRGTG